MRLQFLLVLVIALLMTEGIAQKTRKHKKFRKSHAKLQQQQQQAETAANPVSGEEAYDKEREMGRLDREREVLRAEDDLEEIRGNKVPLYDPCSKVHCGAGRICQLDAEMNADCVCIPECPEESEPRRRVCSNHNETWGSDCAVYQQRCWCDIGDTRCKGPEYSHVHIEYYGECRQIPSCSLDDMSDFPRRMRDWLFNIMRDLADRRELSEHYVKMEREAETNLTRRWTNAAIWKWCELDGQPHDRSVSRHELFPIKAPLMSLEHCIAPFLNSCDEDNDHRITLKEWGKCLELDEDELEDRCDEISRDD